MPCFSSGWPARRRLASARTYTIQVTARCWRCQKQKTQATARTAPPLFFRTSHARDPTLSLNPGRRVNAVAAHIRNLLTPATPHFFNTLYDPYAEGADFVRGYPFSLRAGVPTAVSHGLWLGVPDYDAPTALAKPNERNVRYVDAVLTVPTRTLYPMCGMNLAFDRAAIGPAMYFGLMGDGAPWGRYDDMWAGWCSKVICDHLNLGVKTGTPYIRHARASNAFANLKKEYNGIFWQEACVEFFRGVKLPEDATDALSCYVALAHLVRKKLSAVDPYFTRLADAMLTWTQAWRELNPEWPYVGSAANDAPAKLADATASASDTAVDAGVTLTLGGGDRAGDKPCDTPTSPPAQRATKRGRTAVAS